MEIILRWQSSGHCIHSTFSYDSNKVGEIDIYLKNYFFSAKFNLVIVHSLCRHLQNKGEK